MKPRSFISGVLWLFSGLFLAQLINMGFAFVLPRVYDPADFAHFGVFLASVLILFEINNFKLDYALMLPREEHDSIALYKKAITYSSALSAVLMLIFFTYLMLPLKEHQLFPGWIAVSVFINGIYQPTVTWCNRHQKYGMINTGRVLQAVVTGLVACAPAFLWTPRILLIQGFVMGQLVALLVMLPTIIQLLEVKTEKSEELLLKYIQFPRFGTWSAMVNTLSRNLVFYVLHFFFSPAMVGFYTFTNRLVQAPLGILTGALGQAYFREASQTSPEHVAALTRKIAWSLSGLALIPALVAMAWGPELFAVLFGEEWAGAGEVARWLALWYGTSLVVTPVSMLVDVKGLLKWELNYNIAFFAARMIALLAGALSGEFILTLALFCAAGVIFNLYLLWFVNRLANEKA